MNRALGRLEPGAAPGGTEEAAFGGSPYDDVRRLLETLNASMPTCEARLEAETYTLVRDNLRVLNECVYRNPLTPAALEVVYQHLQTLTRMLAFRAN